MPAVTGDWAWECKNCDEEGRGPDPAPVNREAEKHTKKTGHVTETHFPADRS